MKSENVPSDAQEFTPVEDRNAIVLRELRLRAEARSPKVKNPSRKLAVIKALLDSRKPIIVRDISKLSRTDTASVYNVLRDLESLGLVKREYGLNSFGQKALVCSLTEYGRVAAIQHFASSPAEVDSSPL